VINPAIPKKISQSAISEREVKAMQNTDLRFKILPAPFAKQLDIWK